MGNRHHPRRSRRVDDQVLGDIAAAMSRSSEAELRAELTRPLRAQNLRASFWRAADMAIRQNAGLPVGAEFHEEALVLWPDQGVHVAPVTDTIIENVPDQTTMQTQLSLPDEI